MYDIKSLLPLYHTGKIKLAVSYIILKDLFD